MVLSPTPTFVMYRVTAKGHGHKPVEVPLDAAWDLDVGAMKRAIEMMRPAVVFVASPNNPTGNRMSEDRLEALLGERRRRARRARRGLCGLRWASRCARGERGTRGSAVLRTLSKVGLAALRIGWLEARRGARPRGRQGTAAVQRERDEPGGGRGGAGGGLGRGAGARRERRSQSARGSRRRLRAMRGFDVVPSQRELRVGGHAASRRGRARRAPRARHPRAELPRARAGGWRNRLRVTIGTPRGERRAARGARGGEPHEEASARAAGRRRERAPRARIRRRWSERTTATFSRGAMSSPEAYAAFLRGALAEAGHRPHDAVQAYAEAARRDRASPEPWTRIARRACVSEANGRGRAPTARWTARSRSTRDTHAPGRCKAECAGARGDVAGQRQRPHGRVQLDPAGRRGDHPPGARRGGRGGDGLARSARRADGDGARSGGRVGCAGLLGRGARGRRALDAGPRRARARRARATRGGRARRGGAGRRGRSGGGEGWRRPRRSSVTDRPLPAALALAARLALDEAIARGDADAVRRRATRGRLPLDEAAGRALLAGRPCARPRPRVERALRPIPRPAGRGSSWPSSNGADLARHGRTPTRGTPPHPPQRSWPSARRSSAPSPAPTARAALASVPHGPLGVRRRPRRPPGGGARLARSARRGGASPRRQRGARGHRGCAPRDSGRRNARRTPPLPRPRACAAGRPRSSRARGTPARDRRRRIPSSPPPTALVQLASGAPIAPGAPRALLARNPADPLLAAIALRLAEKVGDGDVARRARETLTAVGAPRQGVD